MLPNARAFTIQKLSNNLDREMGSSHGDQQRQGQVVQVCKVSSKPKACLI